MDRRAERVGSALSGWRMAVSRARAAGRARRPKGAIAVGRDADLVVWDPDEEWTIDAEHALPSASVTPYDGCRVRGRVRDDDAAGGDGV